MQAIYSAASGLKNQQLRLDTIAANIANSNTAGYKSSRVDFKDALYTIMDDPAGKGEGANLLNGCGVLAGAASKNFTEGQFEPTGSALDFSIRGEGFFTVENAAGEKLYTRNGGFSLSPEGGENYLVTSEGYYVLDTGGEKIKLPGDISGFKASASGGPSTNGAEVKLGIAEFSNPDGLMSIGNGCYRETANSGVPLNAGNAEVVQGSIESSNVDLARELTLMIRAQRAYSLASRALQTADEMDGLANNIR